MQIRHFIFRTGVTLFAVALALHSAALAQQGIALTKAGFLTTSDVEAFQNKTTVVNEEIQLTPTRKTPETVFFWTAVACDDACRQRFKPDETVIIHRWVRDYGLNVMTTQTKAFAWQELVDGNLVAHSAQDVSGPGAWFVEVKFQALDGQTLCIPAPEVNERTNEPQQKETDLCKFSLRIR